MVRAADDLVEPPRKLSTSSVSVELTGSSALWANFNEVNHSAMMRSEMLSWPVTLLVLALAFNAAWCRPRWLDRILPHVRFAH